jgi:hypothetical protein
MINLDFFAHRNRPVRNLNFQIEFADRRFLYSETFDFGSFGPVSVQALGQVAEQYARLTDSTCTPQLAALLFNVTEQPRTLDWYFPITNILGDPEKVEFDSLRQTIAEHPNFDLRFFADERRDITGLLPPEVRHLVAGHLAEIFFYRPTLLDQFLLLPKHLYLYATPKAYADDGGQAGGQFHADRECLQIVLSRLFEGYNGQTPGVCPFLHEFGHLLDFFNAGSGRLSRESSGYLPGLRPSDGPVYSSRARESFLKGKKIERDRYMARYLGYAAPTDPFPIGHPYVFQNDTEFIAGYFEMFFRNPNYFASLNPDLFESFVELFGWDTRTAWPKDFPFYVEGNRRFYLSGERPWQPGLTLPK